MSYDNTRLDLAVSRWLESNTQKSKVKTTYARDMLNDFVSFCIEKKAMKGSPGRVAFGSALVRAGYKKTKSQGYSAWLGVVLKNPPEVSAISRNVLTGSALARQTDRLADSAKEAEANQKNLKKERANDRADQLARMKVRMAAESKEVIVAAGHLEPDS